MLAILEYLIPSHLPLPIILFLLGGGFISYFVGVLANYIPPIAIYKQPIKDVSILVVLVGIFYLGGYHTEQAWELKVAGAEARVAAAEKKAAANNVRIETKIEYRDKIIHDKEVVIHERIIHDAAQIDATCKLIPLDIQIHNDAARTPVYPK